MGERWPTWIEALVAMVLCAIAVFVLRRRRPTRATDALIPVAHEFAFVAGIYALWRVARELPLAQDEGAIERARQIVDLQTWLHLPTERSLQELVLRSDVSGWLASHYYYALHIPATIGFLFWMFFRHRDHYPHWRNALAWFTAFSLVIRFIRVAPPRFLTDLGYVDLSEIYGPSLYGPVGTGVSDQFAAMPSIHVGWAAVVSIGAMSVSASRWRWVVGAHVIVTALVVSATGHHWWLDSIVAVALVGLGVWLDSMLRPRFVAWRRRGRAPGAHEIATGTREPVAGRR